MRPPNLTFSPSFPFRDALVSNAAQRSVFIPISCKTVSWHLRGPASTCLVLPSLPPSHCTCSLLHLNIIKSFFHSLQLFDHGYLSEHLLLKIRISTMKFVLAVLALVAVGANAQVNRASLLFSVLREQVDKCLVALHCNGSVRHLLPFSCTRQNDHSQCTAHGDITLPISPRQQCRHERDKRRHHRFSHTNPFRWRRQPPCWICWRSCSCCRSRCFRAVRMIDSKLREGKTVQR